MKKILLTLIAALLAFTSSQADVTADFADLEVGELGNQLPWLTSTGSLDAITVADRDGKRVVVLRDSPNEKHSWMPMLAVKRVFADKNILQASFRLRFESAADFDLFLREKEDNFAEPGPFLSFSRNGQLSARGYKRLMPYPVGEWFDVTLETKLGGDGTYSVTLRTEDGERTFSEIPSVIKQLNFVELIGLMGTGTEDATVEIGRIEVRTVEVN